jgi:HEAT repeats
VILRMSLVALFALVAGVATGMAIGSHRPVPAPPRKPEHEAPIAPAPAVPVVQARRDPAALPAQPTAEELWELVVAHQKRPMSSVDRARLRSLRPEMARYFIARFREFEFKDPGRGGAARQMALEMAISCGGPDAVAFFLEFEASNDKQRSVLNSLMGWRGAFAPRPRVFPISDALAARMRVLLASPEPEHRQRAVILHGFMDAAQAVPVLMSVLQTDEYGYVRSTAVHELGRLGDSSTLEYLRANRDALALEMTRRVPPPRHLDGTPYAHDFHKPVDDAIEEIEERLNRR